VITIYTDGSGPHGNGIGAATYIVVRDDAVMSFEAFPLCDKGAKVLGLERVTNNYAEYVSVIKALDYVIRNGGQSAQIFTDSQLVVKQFNKEFQVKNAAMSVLLKEINNLIGANALKVTISWVPRSNKFIQEADQKGRECIKVGRKVVG
jgi:ribonuclease HI